MADVEALRQQGNEQFRAGNYAGAAAIYSQALLTDPLNAVVLGNRAAARLQAKEYMLALEDAEAAEKLSPSLKNGVRLAKIYTLVGQPREARSILTKYSVSGADALPTQEMDRTLSQAYDAAAAAWDAESTQETMSKAKAGLYALNAAEQRLGAGIVVPQEWQLLRARLLIGAGRAPEAESILVSLLRTNSQNSEALVIRANALYATGDLMRAVLHLQEALRVDPDNSVARTLYKDYRSIARAHAAGNEAFKQRNYAEALELYSNALELTNAQAVRSLLHSNRASTHFAMKKYEEALADCEAALQYDNTMLKALRTKARSLQQLERWEECIQTFKAALEISDDRNVRVELQSAELEFRKSQRKDYYKILGIEKTASAAEIRKAYRKMALLHHPDKNTENLQAEEQFKKVSEAYEVLSDEQRRARYDSGADLDPGYGGGSDMGGSRTMSTDEFIRMFNGGGYGGDFYGGMGGMGGMDGFENFTTFRF